MKQTAKKLYAPTVRYADGSVVAGQQLDVEKILSEFERLDVEAKSDFLCFLTHDLTVAMRDILLDSSLSEADIERAKWLNEYMHQLTSCVNARGRWSAADMTLLVRSIVETSFKHALDRSIGHALSHAAGLVLTRKKSVAAK